MPAYRRGVGLENGLDLNVHILLLESNFSLANKTHFHLNGYAPRPQFENIFLSVSWIWHIVQSLQSAEKVPVIVQIAKRLS